MSPAGGRGLGVRTRPGPLSLDRAKVNAGRHNDLTVSSVRLARTENGMIKYVDPRPFADPEAAARKLMEIANSIE